MPSVTVRVTTFNIHEPPRGSTAGRDWDPALNLSFGRAQSIFGAHGILIRRGRRADLAVAPSRHLLTADCRQMAEFSSQTTEQVFQAQDAAGTAEYERLQAAGIDAPHYLDQEYFVRVAECVAYRVGEGTVSREAQAILRLNNGAGEIATYWVPGISNPSLATADTACAPLYGNIRLFEGIFVGRAADRNTLAHELGHILMRTGHCAEPLTHAPGCDCAPPENLMHASGNTRTGTRLTPGQLQRLTEQAGRSGFLH